MFYVVCKDTETNPTLVTAKKISTGNFIVKLPEVTKEVHSGCVWCAKYETIVKLKMSSTFGFHDVGTKQPIEVFRAKISRQRWKDAWVSPDGNWYNVEYGHHHGFAFHAIKEIEKLSLDEAMKRYRDEYKASETLRGMGWILVQCTGEKHWGVILRGYEHMTELQFKVLLDYFGDRLVIRTWTIRKLWCCKEEARQKANEDD
jgi:hypothetical protein